MKSRIALFSITLLLAGQLAFAAEPGSISGRVVDDGRSPVTGMTVTATNVIDPLQKYSARTDGDGKWVIRGMPEASYLVSADTVNTSWLQKDDSPVVEVSDASRPDITLVLMQTAELQGDGSGGGGGGQSIQWATMVIATGALGAAIVAATDDNNVDSLDELNRSIDQLNKEIQDLQKLIDQRIPASPRN